MHASCESRFRHDHSHRARRRDVPNQLFALSLRFVQRAAVGQKTDVSAWHCNLRYGPGEDAWWASARSSGSTADHPTSLGRCGANAAVSHKNTPDPPFYDWWPICPGACCRWRLSPRNGSYGGNHAKTQLVTRKFARRRGPDLRLCSPFDFGRGRRACKHDSLPVSRGSRNAYLP